MRTISIYGNQKRQFHDGIMPTPVSLKILIVIPPTEIGEVSLINVRRSDGLTATP